MRLRSAQQLQADVLAVLDEIGSPKPAQGDLLEWLNQEWADLYDHLIDADTKWNLQQSTFQTIAGVDTYSFASAVASGATSAPCWGNVLGATVTAGGAGYGVGGTATVSDPGAPPGSGATLGVTLLGGSFTACNVLTPGTGYGPRTTIVTHGTGGGANIVPILGSAYYKTAGLDVIGTTSQWVAAHRFQFEQRNEYQWGLWGWPQRTMYDVWGGSIDPSGADNTALKLLPMPNGVYSLRHWWYPAPQRMVLPTDAIDGLNGAEQAMVYGAASIAALQTEQFELAAAFEAKKAQKWAKIVSQLRDRNIGEAPMARVVRGRPTHRIYWGTSRFRGDG